MIARKQALSVTDAAAQRIQELLEKRGKPSVGVRVGVRSRGCSGLSYTLEYADEKGKFDEVVQDKGVTILIDPKAVMFILGTEMDYIEEKLQCGFTFRNPNEKGRCGCGESFHV
jgi:iron-sulfur cluster assembly protein